eukprot:scaffold100367_cov17-Prasinocladus_malaysianus.AAC.1
MARSSAAAAKVRHTHSPAQLNNIPTQTALWDNANLLAGVVWVVLDCHKARGDRMQLFLIVSQL